MSITPLPGTHHTVRAAHNGLFAYSAWPSVCRDEGGTLYAVASSFRCTHICPFGKTAMFISRDGGEHWSPPIVINDTPLDDRDAGILYLGKGRMLVSWFCHPAAVYLSRYAESMRRLARPIEQAAVMGALASYRYLTPDEAAGGSFVRLSDDYGMTWGDAIRLPVSAPHGPSLCQDGSLIYLGKELYSSTCPKPEQPGVIAAYASTDGGYTWQRRGLCPKPEALGWEHFHEPHVIELADGTLLGAIRAQGEGVEHRFTIYTTRSSDGGATWSPWRCLGISGSPPHLLLHSSGALICSYGRREAPFGERAIVSRDGGESWSDEYILDERTESADLGYPASVELDDQSIVTVYYQRLPGDEKCSILSTRWNIMD